MTRLVVFTTHPIQYQAPWFRALAREPGIDLEVVFSFIPSREEQGTGFGQAFNWDIPLRDGYRSRVLQTRMLSERMPAFARRWAQDLSMTLDDVKPDAALILGWQEISLIQSLVACRRRGVPVIMRGKSNDLRSRSGPTTVLHRCYLAMCDAFMAIGRSNADFYRNRGVREDLIVTAGYFVDNARIKAEADVLRAQRKEIRRHFLLPENAVCFAFVGKLEAKKRPLDFLAALREARDCADNIGGLVVGSGELLDEAKAFAKHYALPVSFAGFLNQSEIAKAYVAADVLVLPSDFGETWGLVVNEAMAAGLPAIVSDRIGAANDLVLQGETGFVAPFADVMALAQAMRRMAGDPAERTRMGQRAQAHVSTHYSIERAVAATHAALTLVTRHNGPA